MSFPMSYYPPGCSGPPDEGFGAECVSCGDQCVVTDDPDDRPVTCDRCAKENAADDRLAELKERIYC